MDNEKADPRKLVARMRNEERARPHQASVLAAADRETAGVFAAGLLPQVPLDVGELVRRLAGERLRGLDEIGVGVEDGRELGRIVGFARGLED